MRGDASSTFGRIGQLTFLYLRCSLHLLSIIDGIHVAASTDLNTHRATNEHGPRLNAVGEYARTFVLLSVQHLINSILPSSLQHQDIEGLIRSGCAGTQKDKDLLALYHSNTS